MAGGDCLADVGMLRAEPGVFGQVASAPTVSRLVDTLAAAGPKALAAIRSARADVVVNTVTVKYSASVWVSGPLKLPAEILDIDS